MSLSDGNSKKYCDKGCKRRTQDPGDIRGVRAFFRSRARRRFVEIAFWHHFEESHTDKQNLGWKVADRTPGRRDSVSHVVGHGF